MFFWNSRFFDNPTEVGTLISGSSAFSKSSLNIWKFMVHILLKPGLENFEHYFTRVWNEYNCAVVWIFFGIALLWKWNENWPFPDLWPLLSFPNLLACWVQHFNCTELGLEISQLEFYHETLALFIVMLPKVHLTSHSRMSGSRWVITPSWLSGWLWYWAHPINNRKNTANVIYIIKKLTWANKKWDYTGGPASFTISSNFN